MIQKKKLFQVRNDEISKEIELVPILRIKYTLCFALSTVFIEFNQEKIIFLIHATFTFSEAKENSSTPSTNICLFEKNFCEIM